MAWRRVTGYTILDGARTAPQDREGREGPALGRSTLEEKVHVRTAAKLVGRGTAALVAAVMLAGCKIQTVSAPPETPPETPSIRRSAPPSESGAQATRSGSAQQAQTDAAGR